MANMLPNIISGVVILVAVICIIVGAKKGFAKLFSKNICILIAMAGAGVLSFLVSGKFAFLMEFENSITTLLLEKLGSLSLPLGDLSAIVGAVVKYACMFLYWVVIYIALKYLLYGVKALFETLARVPIISTFDKAIGALVSVAVAYLFVVAIGLTAVEIVIAKFIPSFVEQFVAIRDGSLVLSALHQSNFAGVFIGNFLKVDMQTLAIIAG